MSDLKQSEILNAQVRKVSGDTIILMFSAGKESICCYYELKKYWDNVILIYQYIHPDLTFVNETLDYFEKKFGQKIYRMPHVGLYRMVNEYVFMSPDKANLIEYIGLPNYTYKLYYEYLRDDFNCPEAYVATGVRMNDSPTRRMNIKVNGAASIHNKTLYPIYDWDSEDIRSCFREYNIKVPIDYKIFGKSFDGIDYRFIKPLKEHFPADFEKLKELYPLIELEIMRYDNTIPA